MGRCKSLFVVPERTGRFSSIFRNFKKFTHLIHIEKEHENEAEKVAQGGAKDHPPEGGVRPYKGAIGEED